MKYIRNILILITAFIFTSACMKDFKATEFTDEAISSLITVTVAMPAGYDYSTQDLVVKLSDPSSGLVFTGVTNNSGKASIRVAPGTYIATTETKFTGTAGIVYIFNGTSDKVRVSPKDPKEVNASIALNVSKTGQIVIKEIFYGGNTNPLTEKSYQNDKYIILYNNSDQIAYLDSLCVGVADPLNAPTQGKTSAWVKGGTSELRDSIPSSTMAWMFPGNGTDNPLQPGEEVVLALYAINHIPINPASVNLGKPGYWAMYDPIMTPNQSVPDAGVKLMEGFWKVGTSKAFSISVVCPAVFIYTLGGKTTTQFIQDTYTWNPSYPANRNFDCLMIDKNLIIDGVECFRDVTDSKRLRPEIDNGFAITDGSYQNQSVHRKIDVEATEAAGGRIVYMDTNNSSNDFEKRLSPSLLNK